MTNLSRIGWMIALMITPTAAIPEPPTDIYDLSWLAGCWQGDHGEECWLYPRAGSMIGINRDGEGGFEYLRIVEDEDGEVTFWASPRGACPATPFHATEHSERRVVFSNPKHDFPQTIEYWIDTRETLHARVSAPAEGADQAIEVTWRPDSWAKEN